MQRRSDRLAAAIALFIVGTGALFAFVQAVRGPTHGDGPDLPPYSAEEIADCMRSLRGNTDGELTSGSHFVDGPGVLAPGRDGGVPVESDYVRVDFITRASKEDLRGTKVQLFVARDDGDASRIFAALFRNNARGYGDGDAAFARAAATLYRIGNVVFMWDAGRSRRHEEQVMSCLG
jgi:hypothetical protein